MTQPTNQASNTLHEGVVPQDVRETDVVYSRIRHRDSERDFQPVRVWRLSPLGIELFIPSDEIWRTGDAVELRIVVEGRRAEFDGVIVWISEEESPGKMGVRFLLSNRESFRQDRDDRKSPRWICSEQHLPRAVAPSPGRFNEFIGFQIRNISNQGMLLVTSIENSFLIPNMRLTLSVNLPLVGETLAKVKIVWMSIGTAGAKDILEIGVEIVELTESAKRLFGQYLAQFSQESTLESLVEDGFIPNNVAQGISFYALKSEEDYKEVIALRRHFSEKHGNVSENYEQRTDSDSRIIVGKLGNTVVACAKRSISDPKKQTQV